MHTTAYRMFKPKLDSIFCTLHLARRLVRRGNLTSVRRKLAGADVKCVHVRDGVNHVDLSTFNIQKDDRLHIPETQLVPEPSVRG